METKRVNEFADAECVGHEAPDVGTMEDVQPHPDKEDWLTPRQERLAHALVVEPDVTKAARTVGVARATAYRWLKQENFRVVVGNRREAALRESLGTIRMHVAQAVQKLSGLLGTTDERLCRLVCNDVLQHAARLRDQEDTERRLRALEKQAKQGGVR